MKKTKDLILENLQFVDILLEVLDARIPISSQNPDIKKIGEKKKRIVILNKSDLVEKKDLLHWKKYFKAENDVCEVLELSAETGGNLSELYRIIRLMIEEKRAKNFEKGLKTSSVRLMVVGIPNVGKSRLINKIVGKSSAGVRNIPGFTRGKQWVRVKEGAELLDMPGILWPKFQSSEVGYNLAITGAIRDEIIPIEQVACKFIEKLIKFGLWHVLEKKYHLNPEDRGKLTEEILEKIAIANHILKKGGLPHITQSAFFLIKDYRNLKLGKIILDTIEGPLK
jgi:ribosome biogenesis GTPase A